MAESTGPRKTKMNRNRRVVSFELQDNMLELLERDARAHSVKSRHLRARDMIVEALLHSDTEGVVQLLGELETKVVWLQTMIQRLAYADLVYIAGQPIADANAWIRDHLTK